MSWDFCDIFVHSKILKKFKCKNLIVPWHACYMTWSYYCCPVQDLGPCQSPSSCMSTYNLKTYKMFLQTSQLYNVQKWKQSEVTNIIYSPSWIKMEHPNQVSFLINIQNVTLRMVVRIVIRIMVRMMLRMMVRICCAKGEFNVSWIFRLNFQH